MNSFIYFFKLCFVLHAVFFLYLSVTFGGEKPSSQIKNSANITYIDIGIHQPNVEDCFTTTIPFLEKESEWIEVYPNPNSGKFTVILTLDNQRADVNLDVFDLAGRHVFVRNQISVNQQLRYDIDLRFLQKGVYFLRVTEKTRVASKQIIIN